MNVDIMSDTQSDKIDKPVLTTSKKEQSKLVLKIKGNKTDSL